MQSERLIKDFQLFMKNEYHKGEFKHSFSICTQDRDPSKNLGINKCTLKINSSYNLWLWIKLCPIKIKTRENQLNEQ